jgi:poly(A) polymerase
MSDLRDKAVEIVRALRGAGFRAYWAGGCVRDLVMAGEPEDYDVATDARPEQITALFEKTIPVGISFGVVKVLLGGEAFEVATFRSDGRYLDGRHPEAVRFSNEREDALRRDFTLNGMFYDPAADRIIDYVGGQRDIKSGLIRAIGPPLERFSEDYLRLLRAVRFSARFGFPIEPQTEDAIRQLAPKITQISAERIRDELGKMLTGPHPDRSIGMLHQTGLLKEILPEVAGMEGVEQPPEFHPEGDVLIHTLMMLEQMTKPVEDSPPLTPELAMAVLLHDVGKPSTFSRRDRIRFDNHCQVGARMARQITRRLRMSNEQTALVEELVRDHLKFKDVRQMRESTLKRFIRQPRFAEHLELHRLDCLSSHGDLGHWEFCRKKWRGLPPEVIRPPRLLTGDDLIEMGYSPGSVFKEILQSVEDAQLEGRISTGDEARRWVEQRYREK